MSNKIPGVNKARSIWHKLQNTETNLRKQVWQQWRNPTKYTTPVFLVGNGRSGTSMLIFHLSRSWYIDVYNEDDPAAFQNWFIRDLSVIEQIIENSYAQLALFKPIKDTYRTHTLLARFPAAKVLFAFRHYNDVINSSRKRFYIDFPKSRGISPEEIIPPATRWVNDDFAEYSAAPPPEATRRFIKSKWKPSLNLESNIALHWLFVNRLFFDLNLHQDERVSLVKYESIVLDPGREFERICKFLEIPFEQYMIDGVFSSSIKRAPSPEIDPGIQAACEELWQQLCYQTGAAHKVIANQVDIARGAS